MKILDGKGILLALFFGFVLFVFGGFSYLALMLIFLLLAILVTRYEHELKRELGLYEHERGWENVLSNGLLPSFLAVLSPITGPMPFIASLAAVTADKFGSEIGVLDPKNPVSVLDFKPVKPGTSGAMSVMGTVGSFAGAGSIAVVSIFIFNLDPSQALMISIAGMIGSIFDTLFGVLEERGIGTKGTTNFICSVIGAIIGYYFIK
ncbi:Uncharacterised protein [Candidatus Bilamarchaeum dharawalense]|uniref:DUF92 domain-containing protein n=1 Tax=Candidatus Bilamarchaeum dharawalense TaxID=2885759 RepID=A0A5E4LT63_9ARCH|nr:Uncharacterised protein [Candidatus Bilamarchaeum dharawalense]